MAKLSTRSIATHDTDNFGDCVNTGYRLALYTDGHVAADRVTRWQGSTSGARYITAPGYIDIAAEIGEGKTFADAAAALMWAGRQIEEAASEYYGKPEESRAWRKVRSGYIVR